MRLKLSIIYFAASLALQVQAIDFIATNAYQVTAGEVIEDEQWVITGIAETKGIFRNDLFILAGNPLQLDGTFEGNIWGASSMEASLGGYGARNVRLVAGKTVRVDGLISGNLMALADTVILGSNSVVEGRVKLMGNSIVLEGEINSDVQLSAVRVITLGGTIEGNVKVLAPDILFSRDMHISGNLDYSANKELFPEAGVIAGSLERTFPPSVYTKARMLSHLMWFIAAFFAGIPFITLFPMTSGMAAQLVRRSPIKCLLVGMLASGALPMFGIMCASAIIGIPLGALILAFWGITLYLSRIVAALVIGTLILRSVGAPISRVLLAMLLGLALIYFVIFFPSIGKPLQLSITWLGMGALVLAILQKRRLVIQIPQHVQNVEQINSEQNETLEEES